ncbi:MAG: hypothetical protein ACR2G3_03870 [Solirubrobacterales bacterium]
MISFAKHHMIGTLTVIAVFVVAVGVAVAQVGGGDSAEDPESGVRGEGVPEGPFVDFCPTPEQVEAHLKAYGFDYKPTVPCTVQGEAVAAPPPDASDVDRDQGLTEAEALVREKRALLDARPTPSDGNPCTIDGEYANGEPVGIIRFTCPDKEQTPAEFAHDVYR